MAREPQVGADDVLEAFEITTADVDLNVEGRLAPRQGRLLRRMALENIALATLLAAGMGAIWLAAVERPILWWQWLLVVVLEALLLGIAARWIRRLLAGAREGVVVCHSGPIHASAWRGKQLTVGGLTYNVPIPLNRLVQGASYDVYVVELPAMVVAMVPTGADPRT
jgi:hypothetical protein